MKKLINKWKSFKKIEKIQVITTFCVALFVLALMIMLFYNLSQKTKTQEEDITIYYEETAPNYFGANTSYYRKTQYNGANTQTGAFYYGACYQFDNDNGYNAFLCPIDIALAFNDMTLELQANELSTDIYFTFYVNVQVVCTQTSQTTASLLSYLTEFTTNCGAFYSTAYQVQTLENIPLSLITEYFNYYTSLLPLSTYDNLYDYAYINVNAVFVPSVRSNEYTSIIYPYSDSIYGDDSVNLFASSQVETLFDNFFNNSYDRGFEDGKQVGFVEGANKSYTANANNTLISMMNTIITEPINFLKDAFNFNFLGINVASLFLGFIAVLCVGYLIKKFI